MPANNGLIFLVFIILATTLSIGYGWGVKNQQLPFKPTMEFSEPQWTFMNAWVKVALGIGVLIPMIFLVMTWQNPPSRQFWGIYLFFVTIQVVSEARFSRWFVPSVVVLIGFLYTTFRLWHLVTGISLLSSGWIAIIGYGLVLAFWLLNLIMLIFMAIPSILPDSSKQS